MKLTHYLYISTAMALFAACSSEEDVLPATNPETETPQAIELAAGIVQGGFSGVETRASGVEDHHGKHVLMDENSLMQLLVVGDWWKTATEFTAIPKMAIGKAGAIFEEDVAEKENTHRKLSLDPVLNWDDYGTADPNNMGTGKGREKGLAIYGVTVAGVTEKDKLPVWNAISSNSLASDWNKLDWTLPANQNTSGWSDKDLLISNNVQEKTSGVVVNGGEDGRYKFVEKNAGKILEFTHAMSKITVNLEAGKGFAGSPAAFTNTPSVTLLETYLSGTVDVQAGTTVMKNGSSDAKDKITLKKETETTASYTATYTGLMMPGNFFASTANILKIEADDNIYYVTAAKICEKLGSSVTTVTFERGKNYIFNIIVDKTEIKVTATIKNWDDVTADPEIPKINVTASVGDATVVEATKNDMPSFGFYLSDAASTNAATSYTKEATAIKPTLGADGKAVWSFKDGDDHDISLYWPDHNTHYFMRGVSPATTTVTSGSIDVAAATYNSSTNLLIGAPVITTNTMCGGTSHTQVDMSNKGICAREATIADGQITTGGINLTFEYMMSQISINLVTTTGSDAVNLTGAKVEIVNGYTSGKISLHDKAITVPATTSDSPSNFTIDHVSTETDNTRHCVVVPQSLTNSASPVQDLQFRVTIYKSSSTTEVDDIYYATIKDIKVKEGSETTSKTITAWERGKHYKYTLNLKKTEMQVTATIKNWVEVNAEENVWF